MVVIRVRAAVVVVMMMTAAVIAETQAYIRKAITVIPRIVVGSGVVAVIVRLRICADLVVINDAAVVIIRRVIYAAAHAHQYGCEQQQTK